MRITIASSASTVFAKGQQEITTMSTAAAIVMSR